MKNIKNFPEKQLTDDENNYDKKGKKPEIKRLHKWRNGDQRGCRKR